MGRLTERDSKGKAQRSYNISHSYDDMLEKLAHYEDMEEQGRLIELPCAMGDMVWQIDEEGQMQEWKTFQAETRPFAMTEDNVTYITDWDFIYCCKPSDFGKTVFLTKEEAEAKLKELEEEKCR